jgi:hypothetical protein
MVLEVIARAKVRPGQLEGLKAQTAEIVRLTRDPDRHTPFVVAALDRAVRRRGCASGSSSTSSSPRCATLGAASRGRVDGLQHGAKALRSGSGKTDLARQSWACLYLQRR